MFCFCVKLWMISLSPFLFDTKTEIVVNKSEFLRLCALAHFYAFLGCPTCPLHGVSIVWQEMPNCGAFCASFVGCGELLKSETKARGGGRKERGMKPEHAGSQRRTPPPLILDSPCASGRCCLSKRKIHED